MVPDDRRELMVHVFYPRDSAAAGDRAVYLPDADAQQGEWNAATLARIQSLRSYSIDGAPLPRGSARYPVAIFLPGGGVKALVYQALLEDLASHGWVVAAVDPPYNAQAVRFPDGRVLRSLPSVDQGWPEDYRRNMDVYTDRLVHWARDISFVTDQLARLDRGPSPFARRLDLQRGVGAFGHSFGGTAAGTARLFDAQVRGAINLDGSGPAGAYAFARGRDVGGSQRLLWIVRRSVEDEIRTPYRSLEYIAEGALRVIPNRPGFTHGDFSDEVFWVTPLTPDLQAAKAAAIRELREWIRAFFDATVRGDETTLKRLAGRAPGELPYTVTTFGPFWKNR
jgi:hypothetical protein